MVIFETVPSASAFGICNTNILTAILTKISRTFTAHIKRIGKYGSKGSNEEDLSDDSGNEVEGKSTSRAKGVVGKGKKSDKKSDNELSAIVVKQLCGQFKTSSLLSNTITDDHMLTLATDALSAILYFTTLMPTNSPLSKMREVASSNFVALGCSSPASLLSVYRTVLPVLTLTVRVQVLPDSSRVKHACHKCAVTMVKDLVTQTCDFNSNIAKAMEASVQEEEEKEEEEEQQQQSQAQQVLPVPVTAIVGVLQRMVMSAPSNAPSRAVMTQSILDILDILQSLQHTASPITRALITRATAHFIRFLSSLSLSGKMHHRAFSLSVATSVLANEWVWSHTPLTNSPTDDTDTSKKSSTSDLDPVHDGPASTSTSTYAPTPAPAPAVNSSCSNVLLRMLLQRTADTAPTVRVYALSAIHDLLKRLATMSAPCAAMADTLFDLAMGADTDTDTDTDTDKHRRTSTEPHPDAGTSNGPSLIELLRLRVSDDSPNVRSKALQALSQALSMHWLRPTREWKDREGGGAGGGTEETEEASLYLPVQEEDLMVLSLACTDPSVMVRKHGLAALATLLHARPADTDIHMTFVQSAMPLAYDTEATVTSKLASYLHSAIFVQVLQWSIHQTHTPDAADPSANLPWHLASLVNSLGTAKVLNSIVGTMIQQGLLRGGGATGASSIQQVIQTLKVACCAVTDNVEAKSVATLGPSVSVSRGAWILLEAVISQEGVQVLTSDPGHTTSTVPMHAILQVYTLYTLYILCTFYIHYIHFIDTI